ncbi:hypothetical protein QTN94_19080 [Vibrio sp. M250220]|uniref:hypothetical protein n=1 Tax=Vibrio sp. M250220 TaxID=3020894 RepID=UPI002F40AE0D
MLKDPDGIKRQEDQDFVDNLPANATTAIAGACTVLMAGTCAGVAGIGEIALEGLDWFTSGNNEALVKPATGAIGIGISESIENMKLPPKSELILQSGNYIYGVMSASLADEVIEDD